MNKKALVKKDLGLLKEGTILYFINGVFAYNGHTFMPEDIFFDEIHFEIIEEDGVLVEEIEEVSVVPAFS